MEFPLRFGVRGEDVQYENGILGGGFHNLGGQNFQKEAFLELRNSCRGTKSYLGSLIQPKLRLNVSIF